jgi:putative RNA 2'-phosphotransferase
MTRLPRQLQDLARMLAYILGRRPDEFGLVLAADGSVALKHLLQVLVAEPGWGWVRRRQIEEVAALHQPRVIELDGERLRGCPPAPLANLRRPEAQPPALLYAAIAPKAHERVWQEGLKPPGEQELLLADSPDLALKVGRRRAPQPVLVTVMTAPARKQGVQFTGYGEHWYLAPALPREVLQVPTPPLAKEPARPEKKPPPPPPGAVVMDLPQFMQPPLKSRGKKKDEPDWKSGARAWRKKRRRGEG